MAKHNRLRLETVIDSLGKPYALLPNDEVVPQSVNQGSPFVITHPNSTASHALKKLAQSIVDEFAGRKPEPEMRLPHTNDGSSPEKGGSAFKKLFGR